LSEERRKTAGELSRKAFEDTTKYDALEVGHALADDLDVQFRICIENYRDKINENEFCLVMLISSDTLIANLQRRKFYAWPFLPKPRPNQSVFLYNKSLDRITHRLWVLPSAMVMAELAEAGAVHKRYETMQAWSIAFFRGTFWDYVRHDQGITLQSETEYRSQHSQKLIEASAHESEFAFSESFDFDKISIDHIVDTQTARND